MSLPSTLSNIKAHVAFTKKSAAIQENQWVLPLGGYPTVTELSSVGGCTLVP
jgi:hypothetical protein